MQNSLLGDLMFFFLLSFEFFLFHFQKFDYNIPLRSFSVTIGVGNV